MLLIRTLAVASIFIVTSTVPASAAPSEVAAQSRVDAVTVYLHSARVTRVAKVDLPAGDVRVTLENLPDQLLDHSLRVSGTGKAKAQVFGATVERVPHVETTAKDVRAAQDKVTTLEAQDREMEDRIKQATARKELLDSLRSTYVKERTKISPSDR
jgi:hypothetical protein